jgi:TetR/AcrR family transcriptional regulator, transcriptional repressor for nem operon
MARKVNEEEYNQRCKEILDAAQKLIYTKGYEQMAIQDILDALGISKGAFYHYFDSKQDLLEALTEHLIQAVMDITMPVLCDPHLSALEKFHRYMDTAIQWKTANKDFLIALYRGWYTDDNAIVRQKLTAATMQKLTPLFNEIVIQGVREGVFATAYPEQAGQVVVTLFQGLSESIAPLILNGRLDTDFIRKFECTIAVYTDSLERVLGSQPRSLTIIDPIALQAWKKTD